MKRALPEGPVVAVSGETVTFRTLINPAEKMDSINWYFAPLRYPIASVGGSEDIMVPGDYQGRVAVNLTNGFLTLGPLALTDSGEYFVNIFMAEGRMTGNTKLQVLGELLSSTRGAVLSFVS